MKHIHLHISDVTKKTPKLKNCAAGIMIRSILFECSIMRWFIKIHTELSVKIISGNHRELHINKLSIFMKDIYNNGSLCCISTPKRWWHLSLETHMGKKRTFNHYASFFQSLFQFYFFE